MILHVYIPVFWYRLGHYTTHARKLSTDTLRRVVSGCDMVATPEQASANLCGSCKPLTNEEMKQKRHCIPDDAVYFVCEGPQRAAGAGGTSTLELVHGSRPPKAPAESLSRNFFNYLFNTFP